MRIKTAVLLVFCMVISNFPVHANTLNTSETLNLDTLIEAIWLYTDESKAVVTSSLDVFYDLSDVSAKEAFLLKNHNLMSAISGQDKISEVSKAITTFITKLDDNQLNKQKTVYEHFKNGDKISFTEQVVSHEPFLRNHYTQSEIDAIAASLSALHAPTHKYIVARESALSKVLKLILVDEKTPIGIVDGNVKSLVTYANIALNKSLSSEKISQAITDMNGFYNGLNQSDAQIVYGSLKNQGYLFQKISVNSINNKQRILNGSVEPLTAVRLYVGETPTNYVGLSDNRGLYQIHLNDVYSVGTKLIVKAVDDTKENIALELTLDQATVTVIEETTPTPPGPTPGPTPGPNPGPTDPVVPKEPEKEVEVELEEDKTPLSNPTFTDVSEEKWQWALPSIQKVTELGIVKGKANGIFDPSALTTRAELITMINRMMGFDKTTVSNNPFTDVPDGKWFTADILCAYDNGIIYGDGELFRPNALLTREQVASLMARIMTQKGATLKAETDLNAYKDAESVSMWAKSDVALCVQEGILMGKTAEALDPKSFASRAEVVVLIHNMIQWLEMNP